MDNKKSIYDLQDRKSASIAFFNATNAAIAMLAIYKDEPHAQDPMQFVCKTRDALIEEFNTYNHNVIASIGEPAEDSEVNSMLQSIKSTKTVDNLRTLYLSMREGLRANTDIKSAVNKRKQELS